MPHKHKRKRDDDTATYDLPPSSRTKPLAVHKKADSIFTTDIEKKRKYETRRQKKEQEKGQGYKSDDTPKAFKRLMAIQEGKKLRNGLDNGTTSSKKRKRPVDLAPLDSKQSTSSTSTSAPTSQTQTAAPPSPTQTSTALRIQPTESLSTFSQRVDQSLPLSSVPKHRTKVTAIPGLDKAKIKQPLTKHSKRLARMQKEWRNTDQRLKDKKEEMDDEVAEKREEDELLWLGAGIDPSNPNAKAKRKKGKGKDVDDADPWKILEKKRRDGGEVKQRSLQDVVQAPPVLKPLKNIFKQKLPQTNMSKAIMT